MAILGRRLQVLLLAIALATFATRSFAAQPNRGRDLEGAGTLAYAQGKYAFAIQAFKRAHQLTLRDGLLFSIARAYRQRYALEHRPYDLAQAVAHYRRYLVAAPQGHHAREAASALAALEPALETIDPARLRGRDEVATRLAVTSNALGAVVRIDRGRPRKLPLLVDVAPGKHTLRVRAPGYIERVHKFRVGKGAIHPARVALRQQRAKLSVEGPSGAAVHVDGKPVGELPFDKPIVVDPGRHFVAVTDNGYHPHSEEVAIARGKEKKLSVELDATGQRNAAWVLMSTGGAGIVAGIVFGVLSVVEHRRGIEIQQAVDGPLGPEDQRDYDAAISARDDFRVGSGVLAGVGFGMFLVGGTLFVFDKPAVPTPTHRGGLVTCAISF